MDLGAALVADGVLAEAAQPRQRPLHDASVRAEPSLLSMRRHAIRGVMLRARQSCRQRQWPYALSACSCMPVRRTGMMPANA